MRGVLPDEAHGQTLRGRKHVGRHETVSGVLQRSDVRPSRVGREAVLAEWVNPGRGKPLSQREERNAHEAAVSRLEPVIRAHEATRMPDVGTSWFEAPPARWATPCAGGQHPRTAAKATGRAGMPGGAPAENLRKGCAEGEIDRSERS